MIGVALWMLAIAAAEPIAKSRWVTVDDYPMQALREGRGGTTIFALDVAANGKPTNCAITQSSGWKDLDEAACRLVMDHARFNPALDTDGRPMPTIYRDKTTWWAGTGDRPEFNPLPPVITLKVASIPVVLGDPPDITVGLLVDATGKATVCEPMLDMPRARPKSKGAREERAQVEALAASACKEASALSLTPFREKGGQAAPSIQTVKVGFALGQ